MKADGSFTNTSKFEAGAVGPVLILTSKGYRRPAENSVEVVPKSIWVVGEVVAERVTLVLVVKAPAGKTPVAKPTCSSFPPPAGIAPLTLEGTLNLARYSVD